MPVLRRRAQHGDNKGINGLYIHSSPPRVFQLSSTLARQLIRGGDVDKLEQAVLEGQGKKLVGEYSADYKTRTFLKSIPTLMSKISTLHDAVNSGRLDELQTLLDEEPDKKKKMILAKDESGVGLLHKAVYYDLKDIYKWLIDNHPHMVSIRDSEGRTAYHYTPMCKDIAAVQKMLTKAGADPSALDAHQHSAKYYMDHKIELELPSAQKSTTTSRKSTAGKEGAPGAGFKKSNIRIWIHQRNVANLQNVVWEGHGGKLLVEHSNNPRIKRFLEAVPHIMGLIKEIHVDVQNGDLDSLKNRVAPPIPPIVLSGKDSNGLTPLHKAAGLDKEEIVRFIVDNYPDTINAVDNEGRTPLHYAALLKDDGKMMNFLIDNGADESALDNKQKTAAYYKMRHNELDAKLLNVVPDCPRSAKESFASGFDWSMLTSTSHLSGLQNGTKKTAETILGNAIENHLDNMKSDKQTEDLVEENGNQVEETQEKAPETEVKPEQNGTETIDTAPTSNDEDNNNNSNDSNLEVDRETEGADNVESPPKSRPMSTKQSIEELPLSPTKSRPASEMNGAINTSRLVNETDFEELSEEKPQSPSATLIKSRPESEIGEQIAKSPIKSRPQSNIDTKDETASPVRSRPLSTVDSPNKDVNEPTSPIKSPKTRPTSQTEAKSRPSSQINNDIDSKTRPNSEIRSNGITSDAPGPIVDDEGVIEGLVDGENEVEAMNNEGHNESRTDVTDIKAMVESGNMEQLAALVLNGDGDKLIGQTSDNSELQTFLENVPIYMSKIKRIHEAARSGSLRELQAALDRRKFAIAKDIISPKGASPLHVAVIFGNTSIVRYLAGRFPETVQIVDDDGRTPLHYAAVLGDNGHYYNLLVHLGADSRVEDKSGHTPEYYRRNQDDFSHRSVLKDFGAAEDVADEMLTDKVPADLYSARKDLDDEDMLSVLERCYNLLHGRRTSTVSASSTLTTSSSSHNSLLSKHIRRHVFDVVKLRLTRLDHHLYDLIWPSVKKLPSDAAFRNSLEQDFPLGIVAPDYYAYKVFKEFVEPIVKDYNSLPIQQELMPHPTSIFAEKSGEDEKAVVDIDMDLDPQMKWIISDKAIAENGQVDMPFFATEEGRYLASSLGDPLIKGLTEVANKRPDDPIAYLAQYLYNFAHSRTGLRSRGKTQEIGPQMIEGSPAHVNDNEAVPASIDVVTLEPGDNSDEEDSAFSSTSRDEHGQSMLHFAAARAHGRNSLFQLLLETEINVAYRDELYRTARDISIQANIPENTEEIDRYVLHIASKGDTDKLVELLLDGYDHITDIVDNDNVPIVEAVAKSNQPDTVSFLQSILAFEEKRERVHHAIRQGSINDVTSLLADENDTGSGKLLAVGKNSYSRCTLHIAVLCQQEEIVDFLANTFPDTLKLGDNLERTALHYAMGVEKMESISRVLIKAGAKRVSKDLKGRQPTYYFLNKSDILRLQEEEETF